MRIRDWSSDVCSSDLRNVGFQETRTNNDERQRQPEDIDRKAILPSIAFKGHQEVPHRQYHRTEQHRLALPQIAVGQIAADNRGNIHQRRICRSEEHTSELQSLMRISYAVFCLKKKTNNHNQIIKTLNNEKYNSNRKR